MDAEELKNYISDGANGGAGIHFYKTKTFVDYKDIDEPIKTILLSSE